MEEAATEGGREMAGTGPPPPPPPAAPPGTDAGGGAARDEQILELRDAGRSYPAIARELGLERSTDARAGYLRALRRQPPEARQLLRRRELRRLDSLASAIAGRADISEADVARRLRAVDLLRKDLLED